MIESSPSDQVQPKLHSMRLPQARRRDPASASRTCSTSTRRKEIPVNDELFPNPWSVGEFRWAADSSRFTFLYNQRGHQVLRVVAVDATTGEAKPIVDEQSDTFIDYSGKMFSEYLDDTDEIIWMSRARRLEPPLPLRRARPAR